MSTALRFSANVSSVARDQAQNVCFHWERDLCSRQGKTLTSTLQPASAAVLSLSRRVVVLFSSLLAPLARVLVASDRQVFVSVISFQDTKAYVCPFVECQEGKEHCKYFSV